MKEIKFRAWDKNRDDLEDRMSPSKSLVSWLMDSFGQYPQFNGFKGDVAEFFSDLIFMQYTGIKDKNGKEIYEGDIVEVRIPEDYGGEDEEDGSAQYLCTQEVKRGKYSSGYYTDEDTGEYCPGLGSDEVEVEVIGNIYENPELIKQK